MNIPIKFCDLCSTRLEALDVSFRVFSVVTISYGLGDKDICPDCYERINRAIELGFVAPKNWFKK